MSSQPNVFARSLLSSPKPLVIAAALAMVPVGWVLASGPPAEDEIVMCYVPGSGTIYRIKEPGLRQECSSPEHTEFVVNQAGPPGPQGPPGPPGPQGPQGDAGPISGWERVAATVNVTSSEPRLNVTAECPAGKKATGGGYQRVPSEDVKIVFSLPSADGSGWGIDAQLQSGSSGTAVAVAVCVNAE